MVRVEGLEPPRLLTPEPKSGASANSATPAFIIEKYIQLKYETSDDLLSQGAAPQVPSALKSLTAVFGMGTGVTSLL